MSFLRVARRVAVGSAIALLPSAIACGCSDDAPGTSRVDPSDAGLTRDASQDASVSKDAASDAQDAHAEVDASMDADAAPVHAALITILAPSDAGSGSMASGVRVSADGRFVAFVSGRNDLVPDDFNQVEDVFLYDRTTQ
jgi:hypothetical protein